MLTICFSIYSIKKEKHQKEPRGPISAFPDAEAARRRILASCFCIRAVLKTHERRSPPHAAGFVDLHLESLAQSFGRLVNVGGQVLQGDGLADDHGGAVVLGDDLGGLAGQRIGHLRHPDAESSQANQAQQEAGEIDPVGQGGVPTWLASDRGGRRCRWAAPPARSCRRYPRPD